MSGISNADKLKGIQTAYRTLVQDALSAKYEGAVYDAFTSEDTVDGSEMELTWLMNDPVMEKWLGRKTYTALRAESVKIPVQSYAKSVEIPKVDVIGDKSGLIAKKVAEMASQGAADKDKIAFDKLIAGFTDAGYDGVSFFSTAHPNGPAGGTQSNRGTSALTHTTFDTARQAMRALRDENGRSLGVNPRVLMVGPKNERVANEIIAAEFRLAAVDSSGAESGTRVAAASVSNVSSKYGMRVVVNPKLVGDYDDYWFLIDDSRPVKPIHMGKLGEPTPSDNLDNQFLETPYYRFSVEFDAAVGFSLWQLIYGAIL